MTIAISREALAQWPPLPLRVALGIGLMIHGGTAGRDPAPEFREAFLILAGTLTLFLGGPGRLAVDRRRTSRP